MTDVHQITYDIFIGLNKFFDEVLKIHFKEAANTV